MKKFWKILICIIVIIVIAIAFELNKKNNEKENIENNNISIYNDSVTIIKEANPAGFAGSSLQKVVLYSNGDVYVQTYSGDEENKVVGEEKVAQNATDIFEITDGDYYGGVQVVGKNLEILDNGYGWIRFENN